MPADARFTKAESVAARLAPLAICAPRPISTPVADPEPRMVEPVTVSTVPAPSA